MWPFGKSEDKKTQETIERIEKRIDGLIKSEQEARQSASTAQAELAKANAKIAELQPRAQNEADLYFALARIMRDIMETGKHAPEDRDRQQALFQSYQRAQQQNTGFDQLGGAGYQSLYGSIFGGR